MYYYLCRFVVSYYRCYLCALVFILWFFHSFVCVLFSFIFFVNYWSCSVSLYCVFITFFVILRLEPSRPSRLSLSSLLFRFVSFIDFLFIVSFYCLLSLYFLDPLYFVMFCSVFVHFCSVSTILCLRCVLILEFFFVSSSASSRFLPSSPSLSSSHL